MGGVFYSYIEDRRANPRDDILTQIATATYPDGVTPHAVEMAKLVMVLFGAGQDTSAKLLGNALRFLCDHPDVQRTLRGEPDLITPFIEEIMRLEGSTKMTSRVATRSTRLGGVDIPAGQILAVALAGANRDPLRFDDPDTFKLDRPRASEHLGFGRGSHVCIGAPLARAEVRTCLENFLEKTSSISLSEPHHGPASARRLNYEPSYGMRGLIDLHIDLTAA